MSPTPIKKGTLAEARIMTALLEAGYDVAIPFGGRGGYDMVWDDGGQLLRVQCKLGRVRGGALIFSTVTMLGARNGRRRVRGYSGRADVFAVFCPDNGLTYIVPVSEVPATECRLRLKPARNAQDKRVRWAQDYVLSGRNHT